MHAYSLLLAGWVRYSDHSVKMPWSISISLKNTVRDISIPKDSLWFWALTLGHLLDDILDATIHISRITITAPTSFKSLLSSFNLQPNAILISALHNMRLGSRCNWRIFPPNHLCVLEQCTSHKDPFKSFNADVQQHHSSSESSAQKVQQELRKYSLKFWTRKHTIICISLGLYYLHLPCEWNENTKLNSRITALLSEWAAWRQLLVDKYLWSAAVVFFQLPYLASRPVISCNHHLSCMLFQLAFPASFLLPLLCCLCSLSGCQLFTLCLFLSVQALLYSLGLSSLLIPEPSIFLLLNSSLQRPPTALSLNLSPPHRLGTCHPPRVTAGKPSTHEVCLHQHLLVPTRMLN